MPSGDFLDEGIAVHSFHVCSSTFISQTHVFILGDNVLEQRPVDDRVVPLLRQVQPIEGSNLHVIGLVVGIHLKAKDNKAFLDQNLQPSSFHTKGKNKHTVFQLSKGRQKYLELLPTCLRLQLPPLSGIQGNSECDYFQSCTLGAHLHPSWKHN